MGPMHSIPVTKRIQRVFFLLIVCVLGISTGYSIISDVKSFNRELDNSILDYAFLLANDKNVRSMVENGNPDEKTTAYLDKILSELNYVDMLVVADVNSIRLFHPEKFRVGQLYSGNDQYEILLGSKPYIIEAFGTSQHQRRAYDAVKNDDGDIIGFVMVSAYSVHIKKIQKEIILEGLVFFILAFIIGSVLAVLLSRSIKKSLLGFEPEKIAELYLQNEKILDSLEEGILVLDKDRKEIYANLAAKRMLSRPFMDVEEQETLSLADCFQKNLAFSKIGNGKIMSLFDGEILVTAVSSGKAGLEKHNVYFLRDKAEQQRLAEQLTGVKHIVAALRANSHEYLNKLHVVLGLLNMEDVETAKRYIEHIKDEEEEDYSVIMRCIENTTIAALIMGKIRHAKEKNIRLTLRKDSMLNSTFKHLSSNELVTAIGNLLENAIDAVENSKGLREISLYINGNEKGVVIEVDDTGLGISKENIDRIYEGDYTTKGQGRGIGLQLVKELVQKYNGTMEIESDPGEGTSFTLTFYSKEQTI